MQFKRIFWLTSVVGLLLVCNRANAVNNPAPSAVALPPSPIEFYQGLAAAIEKARGHVAMDMNGGEYESKVSGTTVRWKIEAGTVTQIDFNYENQSLRSATIVFSPAIHVWLLGSGGFSGKVTRISYDSNGNITNADIEYDNPGNVAPPGNAFGLNRHLEFGTRAEDFFLGRPFSQTERIKRCDVDFKNCRPRDIINRVRFLQSADNPALSVMLKDGATIYFSKARPDAKTTYNNFIRLNAGSGFTFLDLTYEVDGGYVKGALESFKVAARSGEIDAGDISLNLRDGSVMELDQVKFERDPAAGTALIEAKNGSLTASVGRGSAIALSLGNSNPSSLVLDDGSGVELYGLRYEIDDLHNTHMEVGNGSKVDLNIFGGRLAFGPNGYVALQNGKFSSHMIGVWESGSRPDVTGTIDALDLQISSGEVDLNSASRVKLASGRITSEAAPGIPGLQINSLETPVITGPFKSVTFNIGEDSKFRLPGNMTMVTGVGGTLIANDATSALRIEAGRNYPVGRFVASLPFKKLTNASQASLAVTDGQITLPLENFRDGSIRNIPDRMVELGGMLSVVAPGGSTLGAPIRITEGVVDIEPGIKQLFKGVWTADLLAGYGFDVDTSFVKGFDTDGDGQNNDDARLFPVHLRVTLNQPLSIRNVPITFDGNTVTTSVDLKPQMIVQVKKGGGKYTDGDDPGKGTEGGDGFADWQEVFRDKYGTSTVHLYIEPRTYTFTANMNIAFASKGLEVSISGIDTSESISWKKDGGDLAVIGAILGGAISFALTGNPLPGILIGGIAGNSVEDRLKGILDAKIAEKIHGFRRDWHIQT